MQDCSNSSALAMELPQSSPKPLIHVDQIVHNINNESKGWKV